MSISSASARGGDRMEARPRPASAQEMMEDTSIKMSEKTGQAVETIKQWGIVQHYLVPAAQWTGHKYQQAPMSIRIALLSFAALSAIPLACFLGFMGVVTSGCLVLGGLAVTVVEGGFAAFGSLFLLPALGVALLVAGGLGLTGMTGFVTYRCAHYVFDKMFGPGTKEAIRGTIEQASGTGREKMATST
ncbi:hypothetical protein BG000_007069 [Podila horticola]|nr:hypothetical protein BG000_007069 [Podila horticola]